MYQHETNPQSLTESSGLYGGTGYGQGIFVNEHGVSHDRDAAVHRSRYSNMANDMSSEERGSLKSQRDHCTGRTHSHTHLHTHGPSYNRIPGISPARGRKTHENRGYDGSHANQDGGFHGPSRSPRHAGLSSEREADVEDPLYPLWRKFCARARRGSTEVC
jgi:hypothetical protein